MEEKTGATIRADIQYIFNAGFAFSRIRDIFEIEIGPRYLDWA